MPVAGTPGSIAGKPAGTAAEFGKWSRPVNNFSTSVADELKALWPETYPANGGFGNVVI